MASAPWAHAVAGFTAVPAEQLLKSIQVIHDAASPLLLAQWPQATTADVNEQTVRFVEIFNTLLSRRTGWLRTS